MRQGKKKGSSTLKSKSEGWTHRPNESNEKKKKKRAPGLSCQEGRKKLAHRSQREKPDYPMKAASRRKGEEKRKRSFRGEGKKKKPPPRLESSHRRKVAEGKRKNHGHCFRWLREKRRKGHLCSFRGKVRAANLLQKKRCGGEGKGKKKVSLEGGSQLPGGEGRTSFQTPGRGAEERKGRAVKFMQEKKKREGVFLHRREGTAHRGNRKRNYEKKKKKKTLLSLPCRREKEERKKKKKTTYHVRPVGETRLSCTRLRKRGGDQGEGEKGLRLFRFAGRERKKGGISIGSGQKNCLLGTDGGGKGQKRKNNQPSMRKGEGKRKRKEGSSHKGKERTPPTS